MNKNNPFTIRDFSYIAICTSLIVICAWIKFPFAIPFTMQTFGIALSVVLLGGKRALISVFLYILLGAIGLPVFSGFTGGIGILFGSTGGYIFGFLFLPLLAWVLDFIGSDPKHTLTLSLLLGQLSCYIFGTAWYLFLYAETVSTQMICSIISICVLPFILPDIAKLILAYIIANRLKKHVK